MEPDQVDVLASAVFGNLEEVLHVREARFASEVMRDVLQTNGHNRVHDDVPIIHAVATTHFDVGSRPDADCASDSTASYALAQALGEHHGYGFLGFTLVLWVDTHCHRPSRMTHTSV